MTTLTVHIKNKKLEKAVKAVLDALGLSYQEEKSSNQNPSPSGDTWFLDPENLAQLDKGIAEIKAGKAVPYTAELKKELFGE
ncbi:hypothetical protein GCM10023231_04510 [Olivibacter ginsenosidimutans]|uniref:Uncharacterized protein n=1 Tax=Olivibacter ginsenosidimutans TaxID=1176537 RepID=A0ABP9AHZ1_9SPHI